MSTVEIKVVKRQYVAGTGQLNDADAQRIGGFLEVTFGNDPVTPEMMVRAARPPWSEIHRDFDWDDEKAAHLWRLEQARYIIREIKIVTIERAEPTRAYHSVVIKQGDVEARAYVPADVIWKEKDLAAQVVEKAHAELRGWASRYRQYKELSHLVAEVEEVLERIN